MNAEPDSSVAKRGLNRRNEAAKRAIKIVRKFPQIEQLVLAPALAIEIGKALLDKQDETASHCAFLADGDYWGKAGEKIRREYPNSHLYKAPEED